MPGFFDIGMVQRNEENGHHRSRHDVPDRRVATSMAGGWAGEYHLRGHRLGAGADRVRGWLRRSAPPTATPGGLLPDTYEAFKKQRHRWAYGGFPDRQKALAVSCPARAG